MTQRRFHISAIGAAGAGIMGWSDLHRALRNGTGCVAEATVAATSLLSVAEKRRASELTRWVLSAAEQACPVPPSGLRAVFVSYTGDGATTHAICEELAAPQPAVSPMRFTNSVHNAAAAYWSIALRNRAATTSLSGGENGFSAGLIDAVLTMHQSHAPVLLVAYDAPFPFPMHDRVKTRHPLAIALLLSPHAPGTGWGWELHLRDETAESLPATLQAQFEHHVCGPALTWLTTQTGDQERRTVLPYLEHLAVVLEPVDA